MSRPLLRFALTFFLCLVGFSVASVATNLQNRLHLAERGIAAAATWLAHLAGSEAVRVQGNLITAGGVTLNINHECTGVFVLFVLVSFLAAYPAPWGARLLGMAVGITALSAVNVLRIATLVRVVEFYPAAFEYFHEYVWQGAFLLLVTLYSMTWVEWVRR